MPLSEQIHADAARIVAKYPVARSALLPLLHLVQSEQGHVTEEGIAFCARTLNLTKAEVGAVATFYTMFKREPVGDYLLSVCTNPTCKVAGGGNILKRYKSALGGLYDPETRTAVEEAECLGICDAAPVVQVNYEMYGPLTDEEADRLLAACRRGEPPVSNWSGEPAPTFAEVERELSGADDGFNAKLAIAARHGVEGYAVPPAYKSGETDIPVTMPGGDPAGHGGQVFAEQFGAPVAVDTMAEPAPASSTFAAPAPAASDIPAPAATPAEPTLDEPESDGGDADGPDQEA